MKRSSSTAWHILGRWHFGLVCLLGIGGLLSHVATAAIADEPGDKTNLDTDSALVGWWKFDETTGDVATDSSPHERQGKLLGGITFAQNSIAGQIGKALVLEGGDGFVRIPDFKGVTGAAPRTISVWIKTEAPGGNVVSWGKDDFGQMWILGFIRGRIGVTPNGGYYYIADGVHDGKWHHVAAVVRQAELPNLHDDVSIYLDGKIAEVHRIGLLDLWPIDTGAEQDVTIGRKLKGGIDDLRIYSRALTDEDIQTLYRLAK